MQVASDIMSTEPDFRASDEYPRPTSSIISPGPSDFFAAAGSVPADDRPVPAEIADYIADVLAELREMAQVSGQVPLSMLLDLAHREAKLGAIDQAHAPLPADPLTRQY
jgi:hypothetical protein